MGVVLYRRSHLTTYVLKLDHRGRLIKGARFYGRLFPERCDVSPDGKLFVYFAMRGKRTNGSSDPATWTAVCEPPSLTALVFCPNGSTWGGGGQFLRDHRLVLFDTPSGTRDDVRGYHLVRDSRTLPAADVERIRSRFKPAASTTFSSPVLPKRAPFILRSHKSHVASGYDMFDYRLKAPDGSDVEGAEEFVLANWAGWDARGRLLAAFGRLIKVYDVKPGKPLYKPVTTLDIEAAIA